MEDSVKESNVGHAETEMMVAIEKLVNCARAPIVKRTTSEAAKLLEILEVCTFVFLSDTPETHISRSESKITRSTSGTPKTRSRNHEMHGSLVRKHDRRDARGRCKGLFGETRRVSLVSP